MARNDAAKPRSAARRAFLVTAGIAGGALVIGAARFYRNRDRLTPPAALKASAGEALLTAYVRIARDGGLTVLVPRQEMGQGVSTTLPMMVAEEMDADPARVAWEQSPVDAVYANPTILSVGVPFRPEDQGWVASVMRVTQGKLGETLGLMGTGGSTSVRDAWEPMRAAGAAARAMLVQAAAVRFGVPAGECSVEKGVVRHAASGRSAHFGELAGDAARQPIPRDVRPKDPARFRLLGKAVPRLDVPGKVDGTAQFGMDVKLPGMLHAALVQSPTFGGVVASFQAEAALARPGVKAVFALPATSASQAAVVVVAQHWWQAKTALAEVKVTWSEGPDAGHDSAAQRTRYETALASGSARTYDSAGDPDHGLAAPPRLLEATYAVPYLAHAAMEPMNATAWLKDGRCDVWCGNQSPSLVRWFAARAADLDAAQVTVHTPLLGGGFGRRFELDATLQAVAIARRMAGAPVKLIWSREEDMTHDMYRPMALARLRAALDNAGNVIAWDNRIVSQSATNGVFSRALPAAASDLLKDRTNAEGAFDLPYQLPHRRVEHVLAHEPVPVGFWRSVGHSFNAFFAEGFLDECAHAAGKDPFEFRRGLLKDQPRHRQVLETAAQKAGWGTPLPEGTGRGIALAESFGSIVAQVAEVRLVDGRPRVTRVVCAVDCGFALDPGIVAAQMESGIVFGLSAALYGDITLRKGRVQQANYTDYDMVKLADCPAIEVHIVNSGVENLGGVGEPGTPPIAPAVCNALFAATGKRVRELPIRL
jgi:isoquinoline 1-oxidoreductase beta subunit